MKEIAKMDVLTTKNCPKNTALFWATTFPKYNCPGEKKFPKLFKIA